MSCRSFRNQDMRFHIWCYRSCIKSYGTSHNFFFKSLIFPRQCTLLNDVNESAKKEAHEHQDCQKSIPTQFPEIDRIRVKENHLNIKQHEQDGCQEVFDGHRLSRIAMAFNAARKSFQLVGRFA